MKLELSLSLPHRLGKRKISDHFQRRKSTGEMRSKNKRNRFHSVKNEYGCFLLEKNSEQRRKAVYIIPFDLN